MTTESGPVQTDLFTSGTLGYHTFRIPALVVSTQGTLLAIAEGRRNSQHDTGDIDLVLRRSRDNGRTFDDMRVAVPGEGHVAGNPAPVVDAATGSIWLWFCRNNADGPETLICAGKAPRTVWLTSSEDDGETWAEPWEMTGVVKLPEWTWYGTGPGHGLQLASGRLLIPSYHVIGQNFDRATDPYISHAILSDDHGETWRLGGVAQPGTNECMAVQLADGRVYLNERNYLGEYRRAFAMSHDEGESFDAFGWHDELIDPICQAAVLGVGGDRLVFSNAASRARERLTVRGSNDAGQTWTRGRVLHNGRAAYSDLCELPDGTLGCLYEAGSDGEYEHLRWARFSLDWLHSGEPTRSRSRAGSATLLVCSRTGRSSRYRESSWQGRSREFRKQPVTGAFRRTWRSNRRAVLVGGVSALGALTLGTACDTVDGQAVAVYLNELNELRDSSAGDDALLGERFNSLIASGSRDAGAYLAIYRELRTSNAAVLAKLEQIQPPKGLERHHEDFVEGLSDLVTALDEVIRMIEEGNVIEANRLFQRSVTRSQAKQTGAMLQIRRIARSARVRV